MRIFRNIIYANTPTSKACTMWVFRPTVSDSVIGLSSRFRTLLNNAFSRPFFVFDLPRDHGVGDIVFVDVAHILDGFASNDRRCGILDIAEPDIGVKPHRLRFIAKFLEAPRAGIIGGEGKERLIGHIEKFRDKAQAMGLEGHV